MTQPPDLLGPRLMMKRDYAKHRGCSAPYISKLIRQGRLAGAALDADSGMINVDEADRMLGEAAEVDHPAESDAQGSKAGSYTAARAREVDAKASMAEMELARRRGDLLHRDAVSSAAQAIFERMRVEVMKVPQGISLELVVLTDAAALEDKLSDALRRVFFGLHEEFLKDAERRSAA